MSVWVEAALDADDLAGARAPGVGVTLAEAIALGRAVLADVAVSAA